MRISQISFLTIFYLMNLSFLNAQLAQVGMTGSGDILVTVNSQLAGREVNVPLNEIDFKGSPFLDEDYKPAKILYQGKPIKSVLYRYNAYNEEVEVKMSSNDSVKAIRRHREIAILSNGRVLKFLPFIDKLNRDLNGYLFLIVDNGYSLFKRENVKFSEPKPAKTSFEKDIPARFIKFEAFYLKVKNQKIEEISTSRNKFLKQLPSEIRKKVSQFIKNKNLKTKEEKDLIEIFKFLNTLNS